MQASGRADALLCPILKRGGLKNRCNCVTDAADRTDAAAALGFISTFSLIFTCERRTIGKRIVNATTVVMSLLGRVNIANLVLRKRCRRGVIAINCDAT